MPLFIPFVAGAVVVALVGYGGKKGFKGVGAMRHAKEIGADAERRHKQGVMRLDSAREQLGQQLGSTHELKLHIARTTLGRMVELLQSLDIRGKVRTPEEFARLGIAPEQVRAFVAQYVEAGGTLKGTIAAAGTGAAASTLTTALVSSFATASTGAAISGLSGAAAQSALLAWLGGGSLAVGGGGMAVGSIVLGGIAVAPAVAIGGLVLAAQGEKAVTKAETYSAEVDIAVARIDALVAFHLRATNRAAEIQQVIKKIDDRASARIEELISCVETFDQESDADVERLCTAMLLCKALSELLQTNVLDDEGQLGQSSEQLIAQYRYLTVDA